MGKKPQNKPVSFDEIIKSDRLKKQNQDLANQILGKDRKGRRVSAPSGGIQKSQSAKPGSLASRITGPQRSASTTNLRGNKSNPPTATNSRVKKLNPVAAAPAQKKDPKNNRDFKNSRDPKNNRRSNADRILNAVQAGSPQATVRKPKTGLSIKGASGPFVVIASNFAPGTTAADIQSALEPLSGPMLSCRVISHNPEVVAELAFEEKWNAENAIANFHNQRADGRMLSMTLKAAGEAPTTHNPYNDMRAQADRDRRQRQANPDYQNGNFGFDVRGRKQSSSGLYSDEMMVDTPPSRPRRQQR
ncbi:uncharacterized protein N7483_007006 [Penicillium malachiteum]|uniref:uncharacterized protein n=1 Tax=Penicillium malachiteum TaxID=1324776 RepID=UPI00254927C2|nr:uncharacterized protein N7483_007006 [Penicillium malachiteum]KAJ5725649.1 hypothetical protein N7483_007006 [Penicillium malachiteum]